MKKNKLIVLCAPSGSGKTSIYRRVLKHFPFLAFSISAATRNPRGEEKNEVDYYFMSVEEFKAKIANDEFAEWEQVYPGKFYGTLKSELKRLMDLGKIPVLDVDVKGAASIKKIYEDDALVIFVKAPPEEVKKRLEKRGTESPEQIQERLDRISFELTYEDKFDRTIENIDLDKAVAETEEAINQFLGVFVEE